MAPQMGAMRLEKHLLVGRISCAMRKQGGMG